MNYNDYTQTKPGHFIVDQSRKNIKSLARQALSGHFFATIGMAFLIEFIISGPGILLSFFAGSKLLSFIGDFYSIVITGPATAGLTVYYLGIFRMKKVGKDDVFSPFSDKQLFMKGLLVYCIMLMRVILMSFLLVVPGIIAAYKYSMSFKVLADHPELSPQEILSESARIMDGNKIKLLLLHLSFWELMILVNIPKSYCSVLAREQVGASLVDIIVKTDLFNQYLDKYASNPIILISYVLGVFLNVYVQVSECCFYDLASGNLVVKQAA